LRQDPALALGLNVHDGKLTNASVGEALGIDAVEVGAVLA
jgi:alanine dehydrogenase